MTFHDMTSPIKVGANRMKEDMEWEEWGKKDPYFGVLTHKKFRRQNLTQEAKIEFFESGREHINHIIDVCRRYFDQGFSPKKILDFGCGVGRLVIPFAKIGEHVVGFDVSESMLKEALKNCDKYSVQNVSFFKSDDNLSRLNGYFDLIHSFIVFQHIPVERGKRILSKLLSHLNDRGVCAVQITYAKSNFGKSYGIPQLPNKIEQYFRRLLKTVKRFVISIARIEIPPQDPEMQMNSYNLNELFFLIQSLGIRHIHVEFTDHGGELGVFLFFQKPLKA
jgi:2-polyprenyl-3-methyl-5-hydroxy-6-metoxy-1,4-benzoquinol methylase